MSNSAAALIGDKRSEVVKGDLTRTNEGTSEYVDTSDPGPESNTLEEEDDDSSANDSPEDDDEDSTQDDVRESNSEDGNPARSGSAARSLLIDGAVLRRGIFPAVDAIEHFRQTRYIDYDWVAKRPGGYRSPEQNRGWSLYKHEWFNMFIMPSAAVLVDRSVLLEIGLKNEEIPPPKDEDLEEAKGLPAWPIRMQDYHQLPQHNAEICHWPSMTQDQTHVPVLDRSLDDNQLDLLVVHDPSDIAGLRGRPSESAEAALRVPRPKDNHSINYVRLDSAGIGIPWVQRPPKNLAPLAGHLHLAVDAQTHFGRSSTICVANLDLPYAIVKGLFCRCYRTAEAGSTDEESGTEGDENQLGHAEDAFRAHPDVPGYRRRGMPTRFRVIAKVAYTDQKSRDIVNNEARIYGKMPKTLSEHWSGYQKVDGVRFPQPMEAVVPISFGYYVPEVRYGRLSNGQKLSEISPYRLKPITLMEHCGDHLDVDMDELHIEEQLFSMSIRLSDAGIVNGGVTKRTWLVQPGPLRIPASERSLKRPIFHMIDFGRGVCRGDAGERIFIAQDQTEDGSLRQLMSYDRRTQLENDMQE
ncbi:hypothetical protein FRC04_003080 [Tulasnella sp. 424]|nr:hypothetical protein FRC04_003080 [Tulasnella sp. 424]KAG8981129.1 hypothetical protein FRC05_004029 [Tulasnella sp. 425]